MISKRFLSKKLTITFSSSAINNSFLTSVLCFWHKTSLSGKRLFIFFHLFFFFGGGLQGNIKALGSKMYQNIRTFDKVDIRVFDQCGVNKVVLLTYSNLF